MSGTAQRPGAAPVRALLVEDESLIAMLLEDQLRALGVTEVTLAPTLQAGLEKASAGEFDFAVLDVNLNGERSDAIAAVLVERGVPFAFSTGYGRAGVAERFASYPVATKPTQFEELRRIVDGLLKRD